MHIGQHSDSITPEELGHRIVRARRIVELTQQALAKTIGCDQSTVSRIERGRGITSFQLSRIAQATGQSLDFFLRPELPLEVMLRAKDKDSAATRAAVAVFSRFITDYEFLLDLEG